MGIRLRGNFSLYPNFVKVFIALVNSLKKFDDLKALSIIVEKNEIDISYNDLAEFASLTTRFLRIYKDQITELEFISTEITPENLGALFKFTK